MPPEGHRCKQGTSRARHRRVAWSIAILVLGVGVILSAQAATAAPFAYITSGGTSTVSVLDTATNTVVATVTVGTGPAGVAIHPSGTPVYIANTNSNSVSVIDALTNLVTATIPLPGGVDAETEGIAVHPSGTLVYVATGAVPSTPGSTDHFLSVIDTTSNAVVANVKLGTGFTLSTGANGPFGVAVNPAGSLVYVVMRTGFALAVDTASNTIVDAIPFGPSPGVECSFSTGTCPSGLAVHPAGTSLYVTRYVGPGSAGGGPAVVSVIDTATRIEVAAVPIGNAPYGVAVHPSGSLVYAANIKSHSVSVIDVSTNQVITTVPVGNDPVGVAVHPAGTRVYVTNSQSHTVSVIDTATNSVIDTVSVAPLPVSFGQFVGPATISIRVAIDIKPGSDPNTINLGSGGTVPVAIFSTASFDATTVNPTTVTLASAPVKLRGNGTSMASVEDVNGDGISDLVVHVETKALQLSETDAEAVLEGQTYGGTAIRGTDSVRVVP